jgi:hypothetical protein
MHSLLQYLDQIKQTVFLPSYPIFFFTTLIAHDA